MSFARENAFIAAFLILLTLTFVSEAHVWPFMAYDMYARRDIPTLRFVGIRAKGTPVALEASRYFHYYPGAFFSMGLTEILRERPEQFGRIVGELRIRYNRSAPEPVSAIRAFLDVNGTTTPLGEFR